MNINDQMIKGFTDLFAEKDYKWHDNNLAYNVNIFAIRNKVVKVNAFNDFLYCVYRDNNLRWVIKQYAITTIPGKTTLIRPVNINGTAILVPGQYRSTYAIDKHQGKYSALCQRLANVRVYRDNNKDSKHDFNPATIVSGMFGINIHKAGENSIEVNGWSAGCQVFKRRKDFDEFMSIISISSKKFGNKFTYTLFQEK